MDKVIPNPNEVSRNMNRAVDQAGSSAHEAIDKVSDAARPAVDRMASGAHKMVDKVANAAGQAAQTLGVKGDQLKDFQARALDQTRQYVRENPVMALGIALAAGYVLSLLLRSR
jgi:ElaB/YqjD/DUF883 family membrane-anchored ribosome-binding protein